MNTIKFIKYYSLILLTTFLGACVTDYGLVVGSEGETVYVEVEVPGETITVIETETETETEIETEAKKCAETSHQFHMFPRLHYHTSKYT